MSRDMKDANDLDLDFAAGNLGSNANASREVEAGFSNDLRAQSKAAALLGYSTHGGNCQTCGNATNESQLCRIGAILYQKMRETGAVS